MNREEVLYLVPYIFSLLISLGVFIYSWQRRHMRGVYVYSWFVGGQVATVLGFIFELVSPNLETKLMWDKFQWLTNSFLVFIPFLIFSIQFSEQKLKHPRLTQGFWIAIPIIFVLFLFTDSLHHLIYPNPHLSTDYPFPELKYDFTWVVYIYALVYIYGVNLYGISLLIRRAIKSTGLQSSQYWTIAIGFLIPLILSIFALLDIRITPQRDIAPFSFALGNLIVAWGLFRFRLFDIMPIARERILENMKDPMIVVDTKNRVVDMNQAALKVFGKDISQVVGRSVGEVFAAWPIVVSELDYLDTEQQEIFLQEKDETFFYDVNISSIKNANRQLIGRIIVARDITKHKTLESGYRLLSQELEERVQERTEELRKSADQYRAVVENQTEFIVRWKPDGTRTFANEAYCRYFGITYEEALSTAFLPLIAEEDRQAVEEKMSRLISGEINIETFTHRVIKPDGSIGWQEWTDQAICNENGEVVEFQAVGRDITERKLAEESLLNQLAFDKLMTRMLTRFATCTSNELDASIEMALGETVNFVGAEHGDILILSKNENTWTTKYRYSQPHLLSAVRPPVDIPTGQLLWSEDNLLQGKIIKINTLDDYPPEAQADREFSEAQGAKSILSVPIRGLGDLVYGCIDLVSYQCQINWSDSNVTHLKIIGDVIANTLERKRAEENLAEAYDTTLEGWAMALELRDKETEGHSRRVTETTIGVARAMGFEEDELIHIRRGAILHDIGKMATPDEILRKPGPLTDAERQIVMKHPQAAYDLLVRIPHLKQALDIPYAHHEKWNGSGYPRGLQGEEIPLAARIFAIIDVWDALSSDRPYREAWPREKVVGYLADESGKHFDPKILEIFIELLNRGEI